MYMYTSILSVARFIIQIAMVLDRIGYLKLWFYFQTFKLPKHIRNLKLKVSTFQTAILSSIQTSKLPKCVNDTTIETFKYTMIRLLIKAALSCKYDSHFVYIIIYNEDAASH